MKVERMKSKKSPIKIESRHKSLRKFIGRENWELVEKEGNGEEREEEKKFFHKAKINFNKYRQSKKLFLKIENSNAKKK